MSEKRLSAEQEKQIAEIKEQWANEMCPLLDKWEEEERMLRKENPQAPRVLDKHLKEKHCDIEKISGHGKADYGGRIMDNFK